MERRHATWFEDGSADFIGKMMGFLLSHNQELHSLFRNGNCKKYYTRFHGPAELQASSYPD